MKKIVEGFILAGGSSRRMGRDKASLRLAGKTLIERAADALHEITGGKTALVGSAPFDNSRNEQNSRKDYRLPTIADVQIGNTRAALIGLHAALACSEREWAAVLACDLPFVTAALWQRLAALATENLFDAVVPVQADGKVQPLCGIYRCATCLPPIEAALRGEDWSLRNFLARTNTFYVEFERLSDLPNADIFFLNINTPEDFHAARRIAASERIL